MTTGVLLVNLGTPDAPRVPEVRRYLAEFLSDPRVMDMNPVVRWLLLHAVILRRRPKESAAAYAKVWTERGSPLLFHSQDLVAGVAERLGDGYRVELGMRYGNPSIESGLDALIAAGVDRILAWPLFPQYSEAATGSAVAKIEEILAARPNSPPCQVLGDFYDDPGFVDAFAQVARDALADFDADHVLFSYHGLPESQIRALDATGQHCLAKPDCCEAIGDANPRCYRAHCFATTRALQAALGLDTRGSSLSFQSRLIGEWIRPFTDEVLPELAKQGVKRLAILCPAFVADCLETVEEIGMRARDQWRELGGEELRLVPCPNAHPRWIEAVAHAVRRA